MFGNLFQLCFLLTLNVSINSFMPTPSSGTITLDNVRQVTYGSNYLGIRSGTTFISDYYKGNSVSPYGVLIPNVPYGNNASVPASGMITIQNFYNVWGYRTFSGSNVGSGSYSYTSGESSYNIYGWCTSGYHPNIGNIGTAPATTTFTTANGSFTLRSIYFDTGTNLWTICMSTPTIANNDGSFISFNISTYLGNKTRASATYNGSINSTTAFSWSGGSSPGTNTFNINMYYYG